MQQAPGRGPSAGVPALGAAGDALEQKSGAGLPGSGLGLEPGSRC